MVSPGLVADRLLFLGCCSSAGLRQHRAALEAGADPVLVMSWINKIQARHASAQAWLQKPAGRRQLAREEITGLVTALGDLMQVLRDADPADKAKVYPEEKRVLAVARPETIMYVESVRGRSRTNCTYVRA